MQPRLTYAQESLVAYRAMIDMEQYFHECGLEAGLFHLVKLRASQMNGCAFCIDMHWADLMKQGEEPRRLNAVAGWREAPFFDARERAALRWAELVSSIPHREPSDDDFAEVRRHFTEAEIAELGFAIVVIHAWNRLNVSSRTPVPQ